MSLYGMMRTGVSGMNAQANRLWTVADNIANSGTTGYKRAGTEFSSLVIPNITGNYNSGGVTTSPVGLGGGLPLPWWVILLILILAAIIAVWLRTRRGTV